MTALTAAVADVDRALAQHVAADAAERRNLERTRAYLRWLPRPFDEDADPVHVTGSAIVIGDDGRIVLHRHKRLGIWLQPGGHLDAGETPAEAALREAREETGLSLTADPSSAPLVHVDVHQGPRGHIHLDLRYLVTASTDQPFAPTGDESPDVAWFPVGRALELADVNLRTAIRSACLALAQPT